MQSIRSRWSNYLVAISLLPRIIPASSLKMKILVGPRYHLMLCRPSHCGDFRTHGSRTSVLSSACFSLLNHGSPLPETNALCELVTMLAKLAIAAPNISTTLDKNVICERIVSSRDAVFYGNRTAFRALLALRSYVRWERNMSHYGNLLLYRYTVT